MRTVGYACYNKNNEVRMSSSSGGIYSVLAEMVLDDGGVVFAACYHNLEVVHVEIRDKSSLQQSRGSKYVSSQLGNTFKNIALYLNQKRKVLFAGTPCQCGGLLSFLKQSGVDSSNCYVVDFVCHGVPSRNAWRWYRDSMQNRGETIVSVNMRDKSSGWQDYSWKLVLTEQRIKIESHNTNLFMKGFIENLYLRPSCHACEFKGIDRKTDFTLGDYWGVGKIQPEMNDNKGVSLVLVHTEKGAQLFERIKHELVFQDVILEYAVKTNSCIVSSVQSSPKRDEFFKRISAGGDFISVVEELTKITITEKMRRRCKRMMGKIIEICTGG